MRRTLSFIAGAAFFALPATTWARQQDPAAAQHASQGQTTPAPGSGTQAAASQPDKIADVARRAREQKKDAGKPARTFDNDTLPGAGQRGVSTVGAATPAPSSAQAAPSSGQSPAAPAPATPNNEKAWRERFAKLRDKLQRDQQDLQVMQRELGVLNLQEYNDPMKALQQKYTRSDINKKTADIEAKKKDIEADEQAISDAEDELRKAGGDAGWAR